MEFYGKLNLLKTGMVFADSINTVSPRYAQEIQTPPLGCGLEGVLQYRRDVLLGHPQRHRRERVEPGHRSAPGRQLRAETRGAGQAGLQGRRCRRNWACPSGRTSRWSASSAG